MAYQAVAAEIRVEKTGPMGAGLPNSFGAAGAAHNASMSVVPLTLNSQLSNLALAAPQVTPSGALLASAVVPVLSPSVSVSASAAALRLAPRAAIVTVEGPASVLPTSSLSAPISVLKAVQAGDLDLRANIPAEVLTAPDAALKTPEAGKDWAEGSFRFLQGDSELAPVTGALGDLGLTGASKTKAAALKPAGGAKGNWFKRLTLSAGALLFLSGANVAQNSDAAVAPSMQAAASPVGVHSGVLDAVGSAGYAIGNVFAFLFPISQVYKTFQDGHAKGTPLWRSLVLAGASLALGVVSATVAGKPFWGIQNIFGGIVILSVLPVSWWLSKRPAPAAVPAPDASLKGLGKLLYRLKHDRALQGSAVVVGLALAASVGLYFAAAAVVPAILASWMVPAAISHLVLWIQIVTGGMYFLLFIPDIISVLRRKAPTGFSAAFSFQFFVASVAFVVWTIQAALGAAPGSPERKQFAIYAALNAAYSAIAFASYRLARKKGSPPQEQATPPPGEEAAKTVKAEEAVSAKVTDAAVQLEPVQEPVAAQKPEEKTVTDTVGTAKKEEIAVVAQKPASLPRSYNNLPAEAREFDSAKLMAAKAKAQQRARALAKDARLVRVALNLDDPRAHWIFIFHSDSKRKVLTVWEKRIGSDHLLKSMKAPTLWDSRLAKFDSLEGAYTRLQKDKQGFKPVRVELVGAWKGDGEFLFRDERGRQAKVAGPAPAPAAAAVVAQPADRAPPAVETAKTEEKPAPVAEKPAPIAETPAPALTPAPRTETKPAVIPPPVPEKTAAETPQPEHKHLYEGFFGFRWVKGILNDKTLKKLPVKADANAVIDQISRQYGMSRGTVVALAAQYRLTLESPASEWLEVYDRLQKANSEHFKMLDQKKYDGWGSFRKLANKTYAPGWKGTLKRVLELHKHVVGAFIRFPYHLFDMFIFGYFRQNITFEFFHSTENFLDVKTEDTKENPFDKEISSIKWLKASLRQHAFKGPGLLAGVKGKAWFRAADRYAIKPFLAPLITFVIRRMTLAVMSAVAMGILGAFAPLLPMSFALTSIPYLGPALIAFATGLPALVGAVPLVGDVLAPVVGAAAGALLKDMVLGPLLNTLTLSTLLTFPRSLKERLHDIREGHPEGGISVVDFLKAVVRTFVSRSFWGQNGKSFLGMVTVGAEIEGVMTYAGGIDAAMSPAWEAVSGGHKFTLFHSIGAAVERPKGDSPIPFGGAITWGNVLIMKLQDITGFHISDWVMHTMVGARGVVKETASDAAMAKLPAQTVIQASSHREGTAEYKFDPELYKQGPEAVMARIKVLMSQAGQLDKERVAVGAHMDWLKGQLGDTEARIAALQKDSKPITPAERAEYDRLVTELSGKRNEGYLDSKLAELHDIKNPQPEDLQRLRELRKIQEYYDALLLPPGQDPGRDDELLVKEASLGALSTHLSAIAEGKSLPRSEGAGSTVTPETLAAIMAVVAQIEQLRGEAKGEMSNRDAVKGLLSVTNKARNHALRDRRDGTEMLDFHKNMSRLATVMDLALSLNEIAAAQAAITQMMALLDKKIDKIHNSQSQNAANQALAQELENQVQQWKDELNATIKDDADTEKRIVDNEKRAGMAASRFKAFSVNLPAIMEQIDAEDGGASGSALIEYQRRIDLLPSVVEWRTNGNPNDPDAFSMKKLLQTRTELVDNITQAQDAVVKLHEVPLEFAGATIVLVPGPPVNITNPTIAQTLQILADRQVYWQGRRAEFQKSLDTVNRRMDPSNGAMVLDDFGDSNPESLPRWKIQEQGRVAAAQGNVQRFTASLDALASQVNSVAGSNIPMLSGMSLTDIKAAIKNYGDAVKAVKIPDNETMEAHEAQMNLVSIAGLIPYTAHEVIKWAKADGTITQIDKAMTETLPPIQQKLGGVMTMMDDIQADIEADRTYLNSGGDNQALLDRKIDLLSNKIIPKLEGARDMLNDVLIPYQQSSIDGAQPNTSQLWELFDAQKTLKTKTDELYNTTVPWAIASFGAPQGDKAAAHQSIKAWRDNIQKNVDGYDDADGHHKGVREFQVEIQHRKDPNFMGTEVLYGETQPYSLPRKISQYGEERSLRAGQVNTQDAQINEILGKIETLSHGKYNLASLRLPVGVTSDDAGKALLQKVVDDKIITKLGDQLKIVGDEAQAGSTNINLGGSGGDGTTPSGTQPAITISENQQIALLALEAAKRLVPSSISTPQSAPASYAIARFLFSDAVVHGAQDALDNQVPQAEHFLNRAAQALTDAVNSTAKDDAYVDGSGETAASVLARKVAMFSDLQGFLQEGIAFFKLKQTWNQNSFNSIDDMAGYYGSLYDIYGGGLTANGSEVTGYEKMRDALKKTYDDLEATRKKVTGWMAQLNDPHESALRRVNMSISDIQEKTRAVLEANVKYHDLEKQLEASDQILEADLSHIDAKQEELKSLLTTPGVRDGLPAELVNRIEGLKMQRGIWSMGDGNKQAQALVIKKSEYTAFLDTLLGMFSAKDSRQDLGAIKADLLQNPQGLASLIPDAAVLDFGDTADGFYLVYQSRFSVPKGLETDSWVTLGNVASAWGNNLSVTGYQFASPPNPQNAPYGDKGIEVQIESLQGDNWVNYLNVDFHRFAFDIPEGDGGFKSQAKESRLMIFDDYAMMLFGDRLYVGVAGFGDFAIDDAKNKPYYYGGNLKTSLKLTEVMKLNFEQQEMFAKDPRKFMQEVNLDFTGYDPDLNQNFVIEASGEQKHFSRTQVGPQFDVGKLLNSEDAFTVDLFYAHSGGTDDITQSSLGTTILKGFTIKNSQGKPWMVINNKATGELGEKYNTLTDRLSVTLPDQGIVVSGQGKLLGSAQAYYGEIAKKTGTNSSIALSYGSQYVGMNNRLSLTMNTSFTLGELWQAVVDNSAKDLKGGETLQAFNKDMDDFFRQSGGDETPSQTVTELKRVFEGDVARQLTSQDIGSLTRDIQDLRKAGAFMDNTRVRGMVGFVSNSISSDLVDRSVGGGFVVGTYTEMTLSKTQKALIEAKSENLYREGLKLQERMIELTKQWQGAVTDMAQAQWELKMAEFMVQNAPSEAVRREAQVKSAEATDKLHQALLRYNLLAGRNPTDPMPFKNLNAAELSSLLREIRKTIAAPDRMVQILHGLDKDQLQAQVGNNPFNLMDWIPWVDRLTLGMGAQFQDMMANQSLGIGGSVRLPIYDPSSKEKDNAFRLETKATVAEMEQAYADQRLLTAKEGDQAKVWRMSADSLRPGLPAAAEELSRAIRAYRNGLIGAVDLRQAFASWHWYMTSILEADSKAALAEAWTALDASFVHPTLNDGKTLRITRLGDVFPVVSEKSFSIKELALRQQSAVEMTKSNDARIQKFWLDLHVGMNLTASGMAWLPSIGVTGIPVTPVFAFELKADELRDLQVEQGKGQSEYYRNLQQKVEADLALQFYQNLVNDRAAREMAALIEGELMPKLQTALDTARAGGSQTDVVAAQQALDGARLQLDQARLASKQARATINYLLGRAEDAALSLDLDPQDALASLNSILAQKDPVGTQQAILDSRVRVAQSVETMLDKDLKVEQLQIEPVSLVTRSLGRLLNALGGDGIGNPDLVAAARVQTLTEERARDAYAKDLEVQIARARADLNLSKSQLLRLGGKTDPESRLAAAGLRSRIFSLQAALSAMGSGPSSGGKHGDMPGSFSELRQRLTETEQRISAREPDLPVELIAPEVLTHRSSAYARYFHANTTMDKSVRLDKDFSEGWLELRLKDMETPPEVLLALSKLRQEKADRIYRTTLTGAAARADILSSQFEINVRLLRWADDLLKNPGRGEFNGDLIKFKEELRGKLKVQRDEMAALLDLEPGQDPETLLQSLIALVPNDPSGARELDVLANQFIGQIKDMQIDRIRKTLFDGGLPDSFGSEDNLMNQIKANTIAERMSYKGFTPVAAFGMFRDTKVGGLFLEAPDPREIERGLTNVISDVLRKELQSTGRLKELTLRLHLLMSKVEDGSHELEARRLMIETAEGDYRAKMALAVDEAGAKEARAAQERLVTAWLDFAQTMTQTKNDFISLVTELEALGEGRTDNGLRPFAKTMSSDMPLLKRDPAAELLGYWSERLSDPTFEQSQDVILDGLGAGVKPELRERLHKAVVLYRQARVDKESVIHSDFTAAERLDLLTRNDAEGKRLALQATLSEVLAGLGALDPRTNPAWANLLVFFRADLDVQSKSAGSERARYEEMVVSLRDSYWHAVPAPHAVEGAFVRLELLHKDLLETRRTLLAGYLNELNVDPNRLVIKDVNLDAYLKAQQAFDAELIKTIDSDEVRKDQSLARGLDGLYDVRAALARSIDGVRSGRGLLAIDALIMLEQSRLTAARWEGRPPQDIDGVAAALQTLRMTRERWQAGSTDLEPVYALTRVDASGNRLWTVEGWLTQKEMAERQFKTVGEGAAQRRYLISKDPRFDGLELIGGVDIQEALKAQAVKKENANREVLLLAQNPTDADFLVAGAPEGGQAWSFDAVFGPNGLHSQGRVFFFEARGSEAKSNSLHLALHPLAALSKSPRDVEMYVYAGNKPLARGLFPTRESIESSNEAADFKRLILTEKGARSMTLHAVEQRELSLRRGWVELKLNGHGFARDAQGQVVQVFRTEDDFQAELKAFHNAAADLAKVEKALAEGQAEETRLTAEAERLKGVADIHSRAYQLKELKVRDRLYNELSKVMAREPGESQQAFDSRFKLEWDKQVSQDKEFKAAQKEFAPYAKDYTEAIDLAKLAKAKAENLKKDLDGAQQVLEHSRTWSLYQTASVDLWLDDSGAPVKASASSVYGALPLDDLFGRTPPSQVLSGKLYGAVLDDQARVQRHWGTDNEIESAAQGWTLKSVAVGGDEAATLSPDGKTVKPVYRLSHYEDPSVTGMDGKPEPVLLNSRYMAERLDNAESKRTRTKYWGVMPWNWGSLLLEIPRGVVSAPVELLTGRDPKQHHYLGRAYMYKTEGGDTEHHGFFRTALGLIDILNLAPDPVGRYYDPSQFPSQVQVDSRILPGENIFSKNVRSGDKDIHFGVKSAQRTIDQVMQDLDASRERTLSYFQGGFEELLIETRRGRASLYTESSRLAGHGQDALNLSLGDPLVSQAPGSDGNGTVVLSARPGNITVDAVERRVKVITGAKQFSDQADILAKYPEGVAADGKLAQAQAAQLEEVRKAADELLKGGLERRRTLTADEARLWDSLHALAWRIGAQEALEREIAGLQATAEALKSRLAWWGGYLGRLKNPVVGPTDPTDPTKPPIPQNPLPHLWVWLLVMAILGAILSALLHLRRPRRA